MADNDSSLYNIRYNQVTQGMEGFGGGTPQWTPLTLVADGGINQLTGDVTAGPGSGSQVATLSHTTVTPGSYTNANITVNASGRITAASSGSPGKIVQVVSARFATTVTTTSNTYVATSVTASITPTSASNKVLVFVSGMLGSNNPNNANAIATIFRNNTTDLASTTFGFMLVSSHVTVPLRVSSSCNFLDSPATTSSTTYTVYLRNDDNTTTVDFSDLGDQVITLMEVTP